MTMTKQTILHNVDSFVNTCYMFMKISAAEFASNNFKKLINENWNESKSDEENTEEVRRMFDMNMKLNTAAGNTAAASVIEAFVKFSEL